MSGTSSKSLIVSFRLSNEAQAKIQRALESQNNNNTSISDYCKQVIERHAFRHDKRKYRGSKQVSTSHVHSVSLLENEGR